MQSQNQHVPYDLCKPQHILVTGGAGFIGANFVHWVMNNHPEVYITVLDALTYAGRRSSLKGCDESRYTFIHGNICDAQLVEQVLAQSGKRTYDGRPIAPIDAVVHFAAESHNDNAIADPMPFLQTNVTGTAVLLQAVRKHHIRFHHISTDEVYGDLSLDSPEKFTEYSPYRPSSPYAASKAASDHLVRSWFRTYGVPVTISNCSNNFGPYQHVEKFIPRQITNILTGRSAKLYGTGLAVRDWIAVEDHCAAVWAVLTRGKLGETYLIGANGEHSNLYVLRLILTCMGKDEHDFEHVADRPGADRRYALDASKIERELGWRPQHTQFEEQIERTIAWYASHQEWWIHDKAATERSYQLQGH